MTEKQESPGQKVVREILVQAVIKILIGAIEDKSKRPQDLQAEIKQTNRIDRRFNVIDYLVYLSRTLGK